MDVHAWALTALVVFYAVVNTVMFLALRLAIAKVTMSARRLDQVSAVLEARLPSGDLAVVRDVPEVRRSRSVSYASGLRVR